METQISLLGQILGALGAAHAAVDFEDLNHLDLAADCEHDARVIMSTVWEVG